MFSSICLHKPGGVLFEIAADPPGFSVDETYENSGSELQLPDPYEPVRAGIKDLLPEWQPNYKRFDYDAFDGLF
jgi:glyoxalase family protein